MCHAATLRQALRERGWASSDDIVVHSADACCPRTPGRSGAHTCTSSRVLSQLVYVWYANRTSAILIRPYGGKSSCAVMGKGEHIRACLGYRQAWHRGHMQWMDAAAPDGEGSAHLPTPSRRLPSGDVVGGGGVVVHAMLDGTAPPLVATDSAVSYSRSQFTNSSYTSESDLAMATLRNIWSRLTRGGRA